MRPGAGPRPTSASGASSSSVAREAAVGTLPAHQRLHARERPAAGERHLGLVVDHELAALERRRRAPPRVRTAAPAAGRSGAAGGPGARPSPSLMARSASVRSSRLRSMA